MSDQDLVKELTDFLNENTKYKSLPKDKTGKNENEVKTGKNEVYISYNFDTFRINFGIWRDPKQYFVSFKKEKAESSNIPENIRKQVIDIVKTKSSNFTCYYNLNKQKNESKNINDPSLSFNDLSSWFSFDLDNDNNGSNLSIVFNLFCECIDAVRSTLMTEEMTEELKELKELLEQTHNIILHGAPGTGKTYLANKIAEKMGCPKDEIGFVQFHPSYDYTDFVEGIRPKASDSEKKKGSVDKASDSEKKNGSVDGFERKDGVFKEFCKDAISKGNNGEKNFVFIIDEINRGELSKIFGELFYSIDPGYRGEEARRVKTQYQNLIEENDVFFNGFYIPKNVYIIGTMNDIDRSVESMDFAMRRRFTFVEVTAEKSMLMLNNNTLKEEWKKVWEKKQVPEDLKIPTASIKNCMEELNAKIINEEIGLSSAYQIGAAYFLKWVQYKKDSQTKDDQAFNKLWNYHLKPLLKEYLRGQGRDTEENKIDKLKTAYDAGWEKTEQSKNTGKNGTAGSDGSSSTPAPASVDQ